MSQTALATSQGTQSTALSTAEQAPPHTTTMSTIVPMDRENLQFFAKMIQGAELIPTVRDVTPQVQFNRVMSKIVAGTSYGFDAILSQTCFHVMFGGLTLSAQGLEILFRRSGEYDIRIPTLTDDKCIVDVLKRNDDGKWAAIGQVTFTREMAVKAELTKNPMYKKFGADMLFARCMTRVVKRFNPACLQPTVVLGNHFAKESQPAFAAPPQALPPQAVPAQEPSSQSAPIPEIITDVVADEVLPDEFSGPTFTDGEEVDGEVVEYTDAENTAPAAELTYEEAKALVDETIGTTDAKDVKRILRGRKADGDVKYLLALHEELLKG